MWNYLSLIIFTQTDITFLEQTQSSVIHYLYFVSSLGPHISLIVGDTFPDSNLGGPFHTSKWLFTHVASPLSKKPLTMHPYEKHSTYSPLFEATPSSMRCCTIYAWSDSIDWSKSNPFT